MPAPVNSAPYGNILYPGGFPTALGGTVSGTIPYTGVPQGYRGNNRGGNWGGGGRNQTVIVPYAVPVYGGGYADYGGQEPQPPTNVTVVVPQQPATPVIINQTFGPDLAPTNQEIKEYSANDVPESGGVHVYEPNKRSEPLPRRSQQQSTSRSTEQTAVAPEARPVRSYVRDDQATIYLIALKDTTVRQAIGYWVEGNTLKYVTPQASINHLSLDMVDRDLSVRLNEERNLDFDLKSR